MAGVHEAGARNAEKSRDLGDGSKIKGERPTTGAMQVRVQVEKEQGRHIAVQVATGSERIFSNSWPGLLARPNLRWCVLIFINAISNVAGMPEGRKPVSK